MEQPAIPARAVLPYARQQVDEDDISAVLAVLSSDWLTTGPVLAEFEREFASQVGAGHAVACANGTAALHLAMLAADVGPGDKVIVPTLTFAASANAVRLAGGEVVFADVDSGSGLLTPRTLADALRSAPDARAVVVVHLNGQCADLEALAGVAGERTIVVDAAHALGSRYRKAGQAAEPVGGGRYASLTTFSFHPVKTITSAEGGMVTTDDARLAKRLRLLVSHGIARDQGDFVIREQALDGSGAPNPWYYEMQALGLNYRLSELHAALGLSQLRKLERFVAYRRWLADAYDALLRERLPSVSPITRHACGETAWHLYPVLIDFAAHGTDRARLMRQLFDRGVGTQVHYLPVHHHPYYRERYGTLELPGADHYYRRVLSLPFWTGLVKADLERVVDTLASMLNQGGCLTAGRTNTGERPCAREVP